MLEFNLASEKVILFSARAHQVKTLVDDFILELKKVRVLLRMSPPRGPGAENRALLCCGHTGHACLGSMAARGWGGPQTVAIFQAFAEAVPAFHLGHCCHFCRLLQKPLITAVTAPPPSSRASAPRPPTASLPPDWAASGPAAGLSGAAWVRDGVGKAHACALTAACVHRTPGSRPLQGTPSMGRASFPLSPVGCSLPQESGRRTCG